MLTLPVNEHFAGGPGGAVWKRLIRLSRLEKPSQAKEESGFPGKRSKRKPCGDHAVMRREEWKQSTTAPHDSWRVHMAGPGRWIPAVRPRASESATRLGAWLVTVSSSPLLFPGWGEYSMARCGRHGRRRSKTTGGADHIARRMHFAAPCVEGGRGGLGDIALRSVHLLLLAPRPRSWWCSVSTCLALAHRKMDGHSYDGTDGRE